MWSPAIRISQASASSTASAVAVDLESQSIVCGELRCQFTIDPAHRTRLLNGWDDFDDTKSFREQIDAFKAADRKVRPWAIPSQAPQSPTLRDLFGRRSWRVAETDAECVPLVSTETPKSIADVAIIERRRVAMGLLQRGECGVAGAVDGLQQEAGQDGNLVTHHLRLA